MGRQPSRAGSARGAAFQADVLLASGSAGLRQDVPILQRAESIEISNRLGMSESSYEFLGKRIWQWQDVLWAGSALWMRGAPRCPVGSAGSQALAGQLGCTSPFLFRTMPAAVPVLKETTALLVRCFLCWPMRGEAPHCKGGGCGVSQTCLCGAAVVVWWHSEGRVW